MMQNLTFMTYGKLTKDQKQTILRSKVPVGSMETEFTAKNIRNVK